MLIAPNPTCIENIVSCQLQACNLFLKNVLHQAVRFRSKPNKLMSTSVVLRICKMSC